MCSVSDAAEKTFQHIKALNRKREAVKTRAERLAIDAEIKQAKDDWWEKVKPLMTRETP